LIVAGFLAAFLTAYDQNLNVLGLMIGQAVGGLGVLMVVLGMVLREIRRIAFEAAVRAGETTIKGKKASQL